jgi:hypothetical protein
MTDYCQLSGQLEQIMQRLDAIEPQGATLSSHPGVPFTSAAPGAAFDPRLTSSDESRAIDTVFDPVSAMLAPVPDPPPAAPPVTAPADPSAARITPEVIDLGRRGKTIQAIKLYYVDLKTAKKVIDNL